MINNDNSRHELFVRLTARLRAEFRPNRPEVAAYIIGSWSTSNSTSSRDLDLLFLTPFTNEVRHDAQMKALVNCLRFGDPFVGAFGTNDITFQLELSSLIQDVGSLFQNTLRIFVSYAFGPARSEVAIPDDVLHIHVSGPITLGDFKAMTYLLPFHVVSFVQGNTILWGPPLKSLIPVIHPTVTDLIQWDEILVRRINLSQTDIARRKWLLRMIDHRRAVGVYASQHAALLDNCSTRAIDADTKTVHELVNLLLLSSKESDDFVCSN